MGGFLFQTLPSVAGLRALYGRIQGLREELKTLAAQRRARKERQRELARWRGLLLNGELAALRRLLLLRRQENPLATRVLQYLNPASPVFSVAAAEELLAAEKADIEYYLYVRPAELAAQLQAAEAEFQSLRQEVARQLPSVASVLAALEQAAAGFARAIQFARARSSEKEEQEAWADFAWAARRWAAELRQFRQVWEFCELPDARDWFIPREFAALSSLLGLGHLQPLQGESLLRLVESRLAQFGQAGLH